MDEEKLLQKSQSTPLILLSVTLTLVPLSQKKHNLKIISNNCHIISLENNVDDWQNAPIIPINSIMILGNTDMINWTEFRIKFLFLPRNYATAKDHNYHS